MLELKIEPGARKCRIWVGSGLLGRWPDEFRESLREKTRLCIVSQGNVMDMHGGPVINQSGAEDRLMMGRGERYKSLRTVEKLLTELAERGFDRGCGLVALGGGAVGDLCGFTASIYMRGIEYVGIPTTLMAMVDSAIGGKTAVNAGRGKNLVGAFWHPTMVLCDPEALGTLSVRDRRAGWAEVVKYGAIADPELFERLEAAEWSRDAWPRGADLEEIVVRCLGIKAGIVARDERDHGPRMLLNFGHTAGHGLEAALGYGRLRHGEAVAWGMRVAARLSVERAGLAEEENSRINGLLDRIGFKPGIKGIAMQGLLDQMCYDKKKVEGGLRWVLLRRLGEAEVMDGLTPTQAQQAISGFLA